MRSLIKRRFSRVGTYLAQTARNMLAPLMLHCIIEDVSHVKDRKSQDAG